MSNVTSLAIDLAKNVFQLHGTDASGVSLLLGSLQHIPAAAALKVARLV